jgi:hypothetical protein
MGNYFFVFNNFSHDLTLRVRRTLDDFRFHVVDIKTALLRKSNGRVSRYIDIRCAEPIHDKFPEGILRILYFERLFLDVKE